MENKLDSVTKKIMESGVIFPDMVVILGISGGPDSMCLLHALYGISEDMNISIVPVHVNHNLREAAKDEEEHVVEFCKSIGLECQVVSVDCEKIAEENGISVEEAGRLVRYQAFSEVALQIMAFGVDRSRIAIAVAHNADDQSETVLFRIMRGTGVRGLAGMSAVRFEQNGFSVIRPLLGVERKEIEEYIAKNNLVPNRDETNEIPEYTRNKIRLELIPYIEKEFNANIKENLRRLSEIAAVENSYIESVAYSIYSQAVEIDTVRNAIVLYINDLLELHIAVIRRVVIMLLEDAGLNDFITQNLIDSVVELIMSSNPSARITLPLGLLMKREYSKLVILSAEEDVVDIDPLNGLRLMISVFNRSAYVSPDKRRCYAAFDYDKLVLVYPDIAGIIKLRTREPGDFIAIKQGRKKIQDFFVDNKVKRDDRDKVPLVAAGSEVLWIPSSEKLPYKVQLRKGKFSQKYQIDDTTERVLFLEIVETL